MANEQLANEEQHPSSAGWETEQGVAVPLCCGDPASWVKWVTTASRASKLQFRVLTGTALMADTKGFTRPSPARVAEHCQCSQATVHKAWRVGKRLGLLRPVRGRSLQILFGGE